MSEEEDCQTTSSFPTPSYRLTPSPENPEDQLVEGAGRTFAEILVDQLGKLDDTDISPEEATRQKAEPKPFLRRGTGLTRFNLPPDPSQQPSMKKRSQSQPRVRDVKSRLNQETQSFANKKTVAKRSVSISPAMRKRKPQPVSPAKSPKKTAIKPFTQSEAEVDLEIILKDKLKIEKDVSSLEVEELTLSNKNVKDTG